MKLKQIQDVEDLVDELFPIPLLTIIVFFVLLIRLERTDDEIPERKNQIKRMRGENMNNMVEICLKTIGPSPPSRILIPSPISIGDLRKLIAEKKNLPIENLRIILCGNVLDDSSGKDQAQIHLNSNDSLIVAVRPKPPAQHLREGFDFDDDDLKFQLPQSTSQWKKRLYSFMHDKLKLPDMLLMAIFSLSLKMWTIIILWFILAPVVHRWDLGPLYILGTGFTIIFLNLGRRQAGDLSAYSIFNEDFRELPGTLNADRLDRDIRAGQF